MKVKIVLEVFHTWGDFLKRVGSWLKTLKLPKVCAKWFDRGCFDDGHSYFDRLQDAPDLPLIEYVVLQGQDVQVGPGGGRRPFHQQVSVVGGNPDVFRRIWFHCTHKERNPQALHYCIKRNRPCIFFFFSLICLFSSHQYPPTWNWTDRCCSRWDELLWRWWYNQWIFSGWAGSRARASGKTQGNMWS